MKKLLLLLMLFLTITALDAQKKYHYTNSRQPRSHKASYMSRHRFHITHYKKTKHPKTAPYVIGKPAT